MQLAPDVAKWLDAKERETGATRSRLGTAAIIAYSVHALGENDPYIAAATAIDQGVLTLNEVLYGLRVLRPARVASFGKLGLYSFTRTMKDEEFEQVMEDVNKVMDTALPGGMKGGEIMEDMIAEGDIAFMVAQRRRLAELRTKIEQEESREEVGIGAAEKARKSSKKKKTS